MSIQYAHNVMPKLLNWHSTKDNNKYHFGKPHVEGKSFASLKICELKIYVFTGNGNQRLEVHAKTFDFATYLKIVEVAQRTFSDNTRYHFDSSYRLFSKDREGNCSERVVQIEYNLNPRHFQNTHLEVPISYQSRYDSKEDLTRKLTVALNILQKADSSVEEILGNLEAILKV
jgi:hypothetical protein